MVVLSFNFLAILNLFVIVLWPASGPFVTTSAGTRYHPFTIVMFILTVIVVVLDIIFLALQLIHG